MTNLLSSREVRRYVAALLDAHRGLLIDRMRRVREDATMGDVLHYFSQAVPQEAMPALMIEQQEDSFSWQAVFPASSRVQYSLNIWAVAVVDDDQHRDDLISELACGVAGVLSSRHISTEVEPGRWLYFGETPPVLRIEYGVPNWGRTKLTGAVVRFRGSCDVVTADPRLGPVAVV